MRLLELAVVILKLGLHCLLLSSYGDLLNGLLEPQHRPCPQFLFWLYGGLALGADELLEFADNLPKPALAALKRCGTAVPLLEIFLLLLRGLLQVFEVVYELLGLFVEVLHVPGEVRGLVVLVSPKKGHQLCKFLVERLDAAVQRGHVAHGLFLLAVHALLLVLHLCHLRPHRANHRVGGPVQVGLRLVSLLHLLQHRRQVGDVRVGRGKGLLILELLLLAVLEVCLELAPRAFAQVCCLLKQERRCFVRRCQLVQVCPELLDSRSHLLRDVGVGFCEPGLEVLNRFLRALVGMCERLERISSGMQVLLHSLEVRLCVPMSGFQRVLLFIGFLQRGLGGICLVAG
mmetsp:Transcript_11306/g.30841  ORF Transcript_11306/g.30841 Transcript_11306/m.30841 type:complete len:345 (+) Transcript_11306:469-1503(+)